MHAMALSGLSVLNLFKFTRSFLALDRRNFTGIANACCCDWVIEVFVFVVPLHAQIVLARELKSFVNRSQILQSSHAGDE